MDKLIPPITKRPYGGGHVYTDSRGVPVPSVTTILNQGMAKPALVGWAGETTALYAVDHWQELNRLKPATRYKRIREARFNQTRNATLRGSQLHEAAEAIVQGKPYTIPADSRPQAEAYARFRDDWNVSPLATERIIANLDHSYAGTFDLLAMLGDECWLLDLKTNSSGLFPEVALQLAAYANATWAETEPILERLRDAHTGAVWLKPDGGYDLASIRAEKEEFRAFLAARILAEWGKSDGDVISTPLVLQTREMIG